MGINLVETKLERKVSDQEVSIYNSSWVAGYEKFRELQMAQQGRDTKKRDGK